MGGGAIVRGWALSEQGDGETGIALMRQGLAAVRATGAELSRSVHLALQAEGHGKVGQTEAALTVLAEARAAVDRSQGRVYEAELYRLKGELLLALSPENEAEAEACLRQALAIAGRQAAKSLELRAATSLSRLWQQQGRPEAAREGLREIYNWFTEGFDTADLKQARALLEQLS